MNTAGDKFKKALDFHRQNNVGKALGIYLDLFKNDDRNLNLLYLIGTSYIQLNKHNLAVNFLEKSLKINNKHIPSLNNLGGIYFQLNRYEDSLEIFSKLLILEPNNKNAKNNIANCYAGLKKYKNALKIYKNLIKDNANDFITYNNLGNIYRNLNNNDKAIENYKKSIEINKNYILAYNNLGELLSKLNLLKESLKMYEKVSLINSNYKDVFSKILHTKQKLCDWVGYEDLRIKTIKNIENINPFILLSIVDDPVLQKNCSQNFVKEKFKNRIPKINFKDRNSKPKIAYFSSDFKNHPILHLSLDIFKNHNKSKFDIYGFSLSKNEKDEWNKDIEKYFTKYFNVHDKSDLEIAILSKEIGIDIAVDLNGFTDKNKQGIFFNRAAPIQINFLGYPGTMGADFYDFIIADEVIIPKNKKKNYSEKIIYQKNCYQPNINKRNVRANKFKRLDFNLPDDNFVYCNFNSNYKITPQIFGVWMNILNKVKKSVIWIYSNNSDVDENLIKEAEKKGVDPSRIIFAKKLKVQDHLKRLELADLFLDTFPYTAHTTASDAIRMNLPLITIQGETFASRVASSLLKQVGMDNLIVSNSTEYEDLAVKIGKDKNYIENIKKDLSKHKKITTLFDSKKYTKNLEDIYINLLKNN